LDYPEVNRQAYPRKPAISHITRKCWWSHFNL